MENGFGSETEYDGDGSGGGITIADVNGDGLPDLVVANSISNLPYNNLYPTDGTGAVTILLNQGNGTFAPGVSYGLPSSNGIFANTGPSGSPYDVTTADLFGNGRLDVITSDYLDNVTILPNEGNGVFGAPIVEQIHAGSSDAPLTEVTTADVNGDGLPDLLVGAGEQSYVYNYTQDNGVTVILNNGHGGFGPPVVYAVAPFAYPPQPQGGLVTVGFTTADVNGDGLTDLVTLRAGGPGEAFTISLNNKAGGFATPTVYDIPNAPGGVFVSPRGLAVGDLNGDAKPDVVISLLPDYPQHSPSGTIGGLDVYLNNGSGVYGAPIYVANAPGFNIGYFGTVTLADLNGDGRPDIIAAGATAANSPLTEVILNTGDGTFGTPTVYAGLPATAAADLNGDGKTDLVGPGYLTDNETSYTVVVALQGPDQPAICYARGTNILTRRGEVPVEALAVGDQVLTLLGQGFATIRWLGHHRLNLAAHPAPHRVQPIRIAAGAFGPDRPSRDLRLSPGHALYIDGALIQAERLINGATIQREEDCTVIEYWHVELDRHDVLLAENLPAESYLDTGNRTAFVGGGDYLELHPDFAPRHWAETCAELVQDGPRLEAVKARLLRTARDTFGWQTTTEHGLHAVADGRAIHPGPGSSGNLYRFSLPEGCRAATLRSRTWVPSEMLSASTDTRRLGVCVKRLIANGHDLPLDDLPTNTGWDKPEATQRWTTGEALLPSGVNYLVVELDGVFTGWADKAAPAEITQQSDVQAKF